MMLELTVDHDLLDKRADLAGAADRHIEVARTSALRKMRTRIGIKVKKAMSADLKIPQYVLADRIRFNQINEGDTKLKLWIGSWLLDPSKIKGTKAYGVPGKSGGVMSGRLRYPGAFLAKIYSPTHEKIWIRVESEGYHLGQYPSAFSPVAENMPELKGRFPVARAGIGIDNYVQNLFRTEGKSIIKEFEKVFLGELNYQMNVRGGQA